MIQVRDRPLVSICLMITLPASQQAEMILKIAGGSYSPCIRRCISLGSPESESEDEGDLRYWHREPAFYSMVTQGAIEFSDPSRRFARLGDRWMDQDHAGWVLQIRARLSATARPARVGMRMTILDGEKPLPLEVYAMASFFSSRRSE